MNELPLSSAITGASTTNAQQKLNFAAMRDVAAEQGGTKSGIDPEVVASAATVDLDAVIETRDIVISGTVTITGFTIGIGKVFRVSASGAFTLTNNSAIVTNTGANIVAASGDSFILRATAADTVEVLFFSGLARTTQAGLVELGTTAEVRTGTSTSLVPSIAAMQDGKLVVETPQLTTSGTEWGYTSIPSWAKRITFQFVSFSTNGANNPLIQIGDSGGYETSGYLGSGIIAVSATALGGSNFTTGFGIASGAAGNILHGFVVITLENAATFTWAASGVLSLSNTAAVLLVGGTKSLSAALDRVRLIAGGDTGDGGSINITYE